jgi:S1-C subfamily serine protease
MILKQYRLQIGIVIVAAAVLFIAQSGVAQKINFNPIKPAPGQTKNLTDEQQGILAVRNVKPAVVDILGISGPTVINLGSASTTEDQNGNSESVQGTGFIVDSEGLIVTNAHVVENSQLNYSVTLTDGTEYAAKVLGADKYDDVALLKIDAHNLPTVVLGDSGQLETGQTVFAIGNSLGRYQNTVTRGVVSGLSRAVQAGNSADPLPRMSQLIQTDAAVNPGNSGGPLINLAGEVVGMNTLIDTEGTGLNFAVPVNTVKDVVSQIKIFGKASKSYLGVSFISLTKTFLWSKPLSVSQGAYVDSVIANSPAAKAGILPGDVITEVNKQKLTVQNELDIVAGQYQPGTQLLVTVVRGQQTLDLILVLGQF